MVEGEAESVPVQLLLLLVEVHTPSAPPVREGEAVVVDCMVVLGGGMAAAGVGENRPPTLKAEVVFMMVVLLPMNRKRGSSRWKGTIRCCW
jgi:hypothetical protein